MIQAYPEAAKVAPAPAKAKAVKIDPQEYELQAVTLLARGLTMTSVATEMGISRERVRQRMNRFFRRLNYHHWRADTAH